MLLYFVNKIQSRIVLTYVILLLGNSLLFRVTIDGGKGQVHAPLKIFL